MTTVTLSVIHNILVYQVYRKTSDKWWQQWDILKTAKTWYNILLHILHEWLNGHTSKQENTFCTLVTDDTIGYGQIEFFIAKPVPQALVNVFNDAICMMANSGNPSRPQLITYKEIDYVSTIAKPIISSTSSCIL